MHLPFVISRHKGNEVNPVVIIAVILRKVIMTNETQKAILLFSVKHDRVTIRERTTKENYEEEGRLRFIYFFL